MSKYFLVAGGVFLLGLLVMFLVRGGYVAVSFNKADLEAKGEIYKVNDEVREGALGYNSQKEENLQKQTEAEGKDEALEAEEQEFGEEDVNLETNTNTNTNTAREEFVVSSKAFSEGGTYPTKYTCDGERATPPLEWKNIPQNTESLAIIMDHSPGPGDYKWYWTVYNIPGGSDGIGENEKLGQEGTNGVSGIGYGAPCSKGPGEKEYTLHVYALNKMLNISPSAVNRESLLNAMEGSVLATDEINAIIER